MNSTQLRSASSSLSTVAASYLRAAEQHQAASSAVRHVTERSVAAWRSPTATLVRAQTTVAAERMGQAPALLGQAASQLGSLAVTASDLGDRCRSLERERASVTAQLRDARAASEADPARISQLEAAQRRLDRAIESCVEQWNSAERRTEAALSEVTGELNRLAGVTTTQLLGQALTRGGADLLRNLIALIVERSPQSDGHPTDLRSFIDELGPGPFSAEEYRRLAEEYLLSFLPGDARHDIYARNEAVTRAYAEMYLQDPSTYKWAGMAAFASELVGDGIRQAEAGRSAWIPPIPGVTDFSFTNLSRSLQEGNRLVFQDIYWQHVAYEHGGIDAIDQAFDDGEIERLEWRAWQDIDRGRRSGDEDRVWDGNETLLRVEQERTLQPVYDDNERAFQRLSSGPIAWVQPLESPIPGDDVNFQDHVPGGSIADFDDRWTWISEQMLPAWRSSEPDLEDEIREFSR